LGEIVSADRHLAPCVGEAGGAAAQHFGEMFSFSHLMLYHLRNPVLALETQYGGIELLVDS
jgi:hypothetical protein